MDTDNPSGPDASIESRMLAALSTEPEAAPAEEAAAAPEVTNEAVDAPAEPEVAAEDWAEIQADDGQTYKVPAAVKDGYERRADYTRKTMEAANLAKAAQDRLHYAEAREQFTASVVDEIASLKALESQLKSFEGFDVGALYATDPGTALKLRDQRDELRRQVDEKKRAIGAKARELQSMTQMHFEKQWEMAREGAKQRIGTFTPGEDMAMLKQVEALGFTMEEVRGRYADPRILHAIYKAAKWDTLQAGKGQAVATAQAAPPVVKPGSSKGPSVQAQQKYQDARAKLKKSGSLQDAARLFLMRG